jgi:hypothetical protein
MTAKDLRRDFNWIFEAESQDERFKRALSVLGNVVIWIEEHEQGIKHER